MKYATLAPIVQIDAMGAPLPVITRRIAEAAHEFFRLTRSYKIDIELPSLEAGQKVITLKRPPNTEFLEVEWVRLGHGRLDLFHPETATFSWETSEGRPRGYFVENDNVRLVPTKDEVVDEIAKVRFSVAPTVTADQVADGPGLKYQDALIYRARALVLSMPKKDWTDSAAAAIAQAEYMKRVNEVRLMVRKDGSSETNTVIRSNFV